MTERDKDFSVIEEDVIDTRQWHREEIQQDTSVSRRKTPERRSNAGRSTEKTNAKKQNAGMLPVVVLCILALIIGFSFGKSGQKKAVQKAVLQAENDKCQELYDSGVQHLKNHENEEAIDCFRQIDSDWKSYKKVQKKMKEAQNILWESVLIEVDNLRDDADREAKIERLVEVAAYLEDDTEILEKILEITGQEDVSEDMSSQENTSEEEATENDNMEFNVNNMS